ncbi:MAG TPA: CopG family transcriptional regulator [Thermoanaerobaculia bacterium]|jgi:hypothetical protein
MGQVTLYLDNETEEKMKEAAKAAGISHSRWVSDLIRAKTATEWPASIVQLAGAWAEDDFPSLEEIRAGLPPDLPREPFD